MALRKTKAISTTRALRLITHLAFRLTMKTYVLLLVLQFGLIRKNTLQIRAECLTTRYRAALFNMSCFGKFWLRGPDAQVTVNDYYALIVRRRLPLTVSPFQSCPMETKS